MARLGTRSPAAVVHPGVSALDTVLFGEAAAADEGCGYADEGEEVFGLALATSVQAAAACEPGHSSPHDPAVLAESAGGVAQPTGNTCRPPVARPSTSAAAT